MLEKLVPQIKTVFLRGGNDEEPIDMSRSPRSVCTCFETTNTLLTYTSFDGPNQNKVNLVTRYIREAETRMDEPFASSFPGEAPPLSRTPGCELLYIP